MSLGPGIGELPSWSRKREYPPISTSTRVAFRYIISGSLTLVSCISPDGVFAPPFPSTLTTKTLNLSSLTRFGICSYQPIRGAHPHLSCSMGLPHGTRLPIVTHPPKLRNLSLLSRSDFHRLDVLPLAGHAMPSKYRMPSGQT